MITAHWIHSGSLPSGEVHLWQLPAARACIDRLQRTGTSLLSPQEMRRFTAMRRREPAERFRLGRILLRTVLARYLDADPAALIFRCNTNGKPELVTPSAKPISFNLSHSRADTVLAVTRAPAVGVDLEALDRAEAANRISSHFFSVSECRILESLGRVRAMHALMLWAIKESIVKAKGGTIWDGLATVSLEIEDRRIKWSSTRQVNGAAWKLAAGPFSEKHFLAVAVQSPSNQTENPLLFRTFRLPCDMEEKNRFEPVISS